MLFENPTQFSLYIEQLVKKTGEPYLDTIREFCDENGVDYEDVAKLISPVLKQKIHDQAKLVYALPKNTTYTLDDE